MMRRGSFKTPNPCSIFSHGHQGEFFFGFFAWKNIVSCFIESLMVSHCHFFVWLLEFGALYDWSCCNVGFEAFLKCCIFCHGIIWTMLVAYGILTMLVDCNVVGWVLSWILGVLALWKICFVGLYEYVHDACGKFCWYV